MAAPQRAVPADRAATDLAADVAELVRTLQALVDPYRPEQYYMRGPGPKWRAKHDPVPAARDTAGVLALARIKR